MTKYRNAWSAEDREEFEALCEQAWKSSEIQGDRTAAFITGLRDAEQAHRSWAVDEMNGCAYRGGASVLKTWRKSQASVMVTHDGTTYSKARTWGTKRIGESGDSYQTQTLFDWLTVEELRVKAREAVINVQSWSAQAEMFYRLVALCEMAGAQTPHEAAGKIGTTVEEWLEGERAA